MKNKTYLAVIMSLIAFAVLYYFLPVGLDWRDAYRPAALAMLRGESPYVGTPAPFMNAPWALLPFIPAALLPYQIGRVVVFIMGLCGFAYIAHNLKAKPIATAVFLSSASVVGCLNNGNLDWLPMLAFVLPAPIGLLFAVMKPQIGIGIALYWLVTSWRDGGVEQIVKVFTPVTLLTLASFVFYGFWFTGFLQMDGSINNMSIFPYGIIVGLIMLILSFKKGDRLAMGSSPLLSPYVSQFSWAALLVPFVDRPLILAGVSLVLWTPVILRVMG